jgi:hypothetical protein
LADKVDVLVDITIRHDFIGPGRSGLSQGQLRNPDNPDHISLESSAADKIRNYRDAYVVNRQVAFLPACMTTSERIHGEFLRLLFFLSNKEADDYFAALGYEAHKEEFCHRRCVFFYSNRCTIGLACAQAVALPAPPPQLVATSPPLATGRPDTSPPITFDGPTLVRVLRVVLLFEYSEPSRLPSVFWSCRCPWRVLLNKRNLLSKFG